MILFTHSVQHNRSSKNNLTKNAIINISYVSKYTNEQSENRHLPTKKTMTCTKIPRYSSQNKIPEIP